MVSAVMIVTVTVTAITGIPDVLQMSESLWFGVIHFLHQIFVHLFAVVHTFGFDLKCLVEKVVATGDEINEVADRSRGVRFSVEMDMDAAGAVCHATSFSQAANNILQSSDVFMVSKDRANQLTGIF